MMKRELPAAERHLRMDFLEADLVVVGGGLAGVGAAVTAARAGIRVVLMQDRPILGGNGSSEVRLWALGATCHMGSNNRWAREGGLIDEILVENLYRNPEGNPLIFDTVVLEKVMEESRITLLLNTAAFEIEKIPGDSDRIAAVRGFCSQNSTIYECRAPLFCDASGDGVIGFLAGAAFRMGAEAKDEFHEAFAPSGEFGHLLGHSIYFYSKDVGRPVKFTPPSFALKDVPGKIPRYRSFDAKTHGCRLWWIEWGGRLDTVHDTERIKWELWRVVYGVWDYIKNSGKFPEAESLTLEWVGHIPGKRESRRFEGDYMLSQDDIVKRREHADGVAFGGWSIDLHPADGVFAEMAGSHHLHSKGIYSIPYRCYYSRNIENLFVAGRIISTTHVAFGSTRVMATCAHGGQAVGMAAALCKRWGCLPRAAGEPGRIEVLQRELLRTGQHLPGKRLDDPDDLIRKARISATSTLLLDDLPPDGPWLGLDRPLAQMIPLAGGPVPKMTLRVGAGAETMLRAELRAASRREHHTPDVVLARQEVPLIRGNQDVTFDFGVSLDGPQYVFLVVACNDRLSVASTQRRVTGLLSLAYLRDERTSAMGGEDYEVWTPRRRPHGHNFALRFDPPVEAHGPEMARNGVQRPTHATNAWAASFADVQPSWRADWEHPQAIGRVELFFDVDYDHAMESVLWGHPETAVPFCVRDYAVFDGEGNQLREIRNNHQARNTLVFDPPVKTRSLVIEVRAMHGGKECPATMMEARAYLA
jgi:hypothetical protein